MQPYVSSDNYYKVEKKNYVEFLSNNFKDMGIKLGWKEFAELRDIIIWKQILVSYIGRNLKPIKGNTPCWVCEGLLIFSALAAYMIKRSVQFHSVHSYWFWKPRCSWRYYFIFIFSIFSLDRDSTEMHGQLGANSSNQCWYMVTM